MDEVITRFLNSAAGSIPALDLLASWAGRLGVPVLVILVAVQWWSRIDRPHVRHACLSAGLSFLLGLGVNQIVIAIIHRVRPYDAGITHLIVEKSADWSFPSDHATASVAIAAAFALQRLPLRALLFALVALAICLSRVYVGTHYVSDVLGGALTGICAAVLVKLLYRENSRLDRLATGIF